MPLFSPYVYVNKKKEKFYLHVRTRGNRVLYYFSKDPIDALNNLPSGYEVFENEKSNMPMIRKKKGLFGLFSPKTKKTEIQ